MLHLERYARWVADYYPVDSVEELGGGRLEARLRVGDPRWLVRLALRVAPASRSSSRAELGEEVARTAAATLALYDDAADTERPERPSGGLRQVHGVPWRP